MSDSKDVTFSLIIAKQAGWQRLVYQVRFAPESRARVILGELEGLGELNDWVRLAIRPVLVGRPGKEAGRGLDVISMTRGWVRVREAWFVECIADNAVWPRETIRVAEVELFAAGEFIQAELETKVEKRITELLERFLADKKAKNQAKARA
jgi:hypothetical protein